MHYREFWERLDEVFGDVYGRSVAVDVILVAVGGMNVTEALAAGVAPRDAWVALCDEMDIPESERWPKEQRRDSPSAE